MPFYLPVLSHLKCRVDHCSHTEYCRSEDLEELSNMEKLKQKNRISAVEKNLKHWEMKLSKSNSHLNV